MNRLTFRFCPFLLLVAPVLSPRLQAQPVVNAVLNAASYAIPGLPHSDIAQGSMFVIFGQQLGPAALQLATAPFGPQLGGTSIRITGGGVTADAVLIYTSAAQVAAILPSRIPPGDATVTVTYTNQASTPTSIRVARSSFGIFTRNEAGSGPGIVQNYNSATDQPVNALTAPVRPAQVMILWGTGLGPVSFDETQLPRVGDLDVEVEVVVGNKSARILYKGRSPQFPGIDQINFEVPADAPVGCHVPLVVRAGGVVSNFASIAIASAGAICSDAIGYSAADMDKLRSPGLLRIGEVTLKKTTIVDLKGSLDAVTSFFSRHVTATALNAVSFETDTLPYGTCTVVSGSVRVEDLELPGDPTGVPRLRGGAYINLQGPRGSKQIEKRSNAEYYGASVGGGIPGLTNDWGPEYLVPGLYTVDHQAGPIGAGAFRATLTLPAPIQWTNQDSFSVVRRSEDLTVTWTGGDSAKEYVVVGGTSFDTTRKVSAEITCVERASAGRFTIPSWLLSTLPATSGLFPGTSLPYGMVGIITYTIVEPARFQTQGIDVGYFGYKVMTYKLVAFR